MKNITTLLALLLTTITLAQSPWTKEKGKFYTQISFTTIPNYDTLFGDPDYSTFGTYSDNTVQFFGEYGLSDKTSLLVNLPLKIITIKDFENPAIDCVGDCSENFNTTALGNIEIGLKHNFYKKDWILSGQFSIEANTNSYDANSGIRTGYNAWTFTPLFLVGRGFGKTYVQGFIGGNIRTNNYSSNFKIGAEVGRKITKNIWLIGYLDIFKSLKNGDVVLPTANTITGLYVNDQEFGGVGLKAIGEFTDNFGVTAGFGGAFFANNLPKQAAITFGLYHKF
ncbi:hypothetical protein JL193_09155 [Polaribacter batillariae]|uniref:MetA-pathway of phenol degradation n=1 Tax=Polaribacter batillariae TaxID=2808900 RepID=A0ABX7STP5_9FLAO|nr:hypothetical protein [Polaribacter batillariae]QTD36331.1 hypothetical protein JL193_09155 [Polaribacter batillariae]